MAIEIAIAIEIYLAVDRLYRVIEICTCDF